MKIWLFFALKLSFAIIAAGFVFFKFIWPIRKLILRAFNDESALSYVAAFTPVVLLGLALNLLIVFLPGVRFYVGALKRLHH